MATEEQVAEALTCIKAVKERLEDWRDDAQMRLERSPVGTEPQLRNLRNNYQHLAELLLQAELALGPLRPIPSAEKHDASWVHALYPPDEPANPDSVVRERA